MEVISAGYDEDHKLGAAKAVLGQIGVALEYAGVSSNHIKQGLVCLTEKNRHF